MKMKFFDVNLCIGKNPTSGIVVDVDEILCKMKELNIEKAVVYHILQRYAHPVDAYKFLINAIEGKDALYGIVPVLPTSTEEMEKIDFKVFKKHKIVGCAFLPRVHRYVFHTDVVGDILSELEARNFPVFLDMMAEFLIGGFSYDIRDLYNTLVDFPKLTLILYNLGIWNSDRYTWPLLEKYENVYLESSLVSLWEGGMEEAVKKFGAERIVFGTGFPDRYMESPLLKLVHAEISEEDKEKIAYKNIEHLIGRIRYE
ncbi:MAG: amidohydrolase [bacterium]|nr:amidohydrolase [bacterium]